MHLETPQLVLRELQLSDAAAYSAYNEWPEFYRYLTHQPDQAKTAAYLEKAARRNTGNPRLYYYLGLTVKNSDTLIGDIVLAVDAKHPESLGAIGYGLNPDFWGKGFMTEALLAVTSFGHDTLGLHRITTGVDEANTGSWRVLEKCGYVREGSQAYAVKTPFGWSQNTLQYASVQPSLIA